jgi:DNA-binding XRE family transcriptional regulator
MKAKTNHIEVLAWFEKAHSIPRFKLDKKVVKKKRGGRRDSYLIIITESVCEQIAYFRQKRQLTQIELASNVGINLKRLIEIEAGLRIPRINELVQLATRLGISFDELVKELPRSEYFL